MEKKAIKSPVLPTLSAIMQYKEKQGVDETPKILSVRHHRQIS